jgi:2-polyprenyl-3-methyl-5-hydroxy-6-metoxy-1,4-benzoquinol methylase
MQFDLACQDLAVDGERFEDLYTWTRNNWVDIRRGNMLPIEWELNVIADSLSKYLNEDKLSIRQKLKNEYIDPGSSVQRAWTSAKPESDSEIEAFYRRTDSYLYDLLLVHRTSERRRWRDVATSLMMKHKVRRLLDYGGGCGDDSLHFSRLGIECTLYDISPVNTGYAKFRADDLGVNLKVLNCLPENQKFDAVYCTELLEHVPNPLDEIKKMFSLLLPGGVVVLTHSFELIGENYPSRLERHRGLSDRFISEVEKLGYKYLERAIVPGNWFLVFEKHTERNPDVCDEALEAQKFPGIV